MGPPRFDGRLVDDQHLHLGIPGTPYFFRGVQELLETKSDFPQMFLSLQNPFTLCII
jgi:hypothetical protein